MWTTLNATIYISINYVVKLLKSQGLLQVDILDILCIRSIFPAYLFKLILCIRKNEFHNVD